MPEPVHTPIGARLRERTQPLAPDDETYGYAHAYLCEAIGRMLYQVGQVFDPEGDVPPLAPILSPDLCPDWALPWLGQLVGVRLPQGISSADARTMINDVAGFRRGTPEALRTAAGFSLTGSKTVYFNERKDGDAYLLQVATLSGETPDPDAVLQLLLAQKPGGIVLEYDAVEASSYALVDARFDNYAEVNATYATYTDLLNDSPQP